MSNGFSLFIRLVLALIEALALYRKKKEQEAHNNATDSIKDNPGAFMREHFNSPNGVQQPTAHTDMQPIESTSQTDATRNGK